MAEMRLEGIDPRPFGVTLLRRDRRERAFISPDPSESTYWPHHVTVSLRSRSSSLPTRKLIVDPSQILSVGDLLDTIFVELLSALVPPLSYGKDWILESSYGFSSFNRFIHVPPEWIVATREQRRHVPATSLASDWSTRSTLGITAPSSLAVLLEKEIPDDVMMIVSPNADIRRELRQDPKAPLRIPLEPFAGRIADLPIAWTISISGFVVGMAGLQAGKIYQVPDGYNWRRLSPWS
jgi:hypothetical protein